jgi:hypothetical protein
MSAQIAAALARAKKTDWPKHENAPQLLYHNSDSKFASLLSLHHTLDSALKLVSLKTPFQTVITFLIKNHSTNLNFVNTYIAFHKNNFHFIDYSRLFFISSPQR